MKKSISIINYKKTCNKAAFSEKKSSIKSKNMRKSGCFSLANAFFQQVQINLTEKRSLKIQHINIRKKKLLDEDLFAITHAENFCGESNGKLQLSDTSIFTSNFVTLFQKTLGSAEVFNKMTAVKQRNHFYELSKLIELETNWKALGIKPDYVNNRRIEEIFCKELESFTIILRDNFFLADGNKNVNKKFPIAKIRLFLTNFVGLVGDKKFSFIKTCCFTSSTIAEHVELTLSALDPEILFCNAVRVCIKCAFDDMFKSESTEAIYSDDILKDNVLFVKRIVVQYELHALLIKYLVSLWLGIIRDLKGLTVDNVESSDMNRYVDFFVKDLGNELSLFKWYSELFDVVLLIIDFLGEAKFFVSEQNIKKNIKGSIEQNKIFELDQKARCFIPLSTRIPQIVKPSKLKNTDDARRLTANFSTGTSRVLYSKKSLLALNRAHNKKFQVNEVFLEIINCLYYQSSNYAQNLARAGGMEYTTGAGCLDVMVCVQQLSKKYAHMKFQRFQHNQDVVGLEGQLGSFSTDYKISQEATLKCGITSLEVLSHLRLDRSLQKARALHKKRQLLLTSMTIAELLKGFPVYYANRLDFRTRMYPRQYLMSRTSGSLKHLLMDFNGETLTRGGMINLMRAYFAIDPQAAKLFEEKVRLWDDKGHELLKRLECYYHENRLDLSSYGKDVSYVLLLEWQLRTVFAGGVHTKVHLNVEIDQNASGIVFMALLFRNKSLAEQCNLLTSDTQDVYTFTNQAVRNFILGKEISYVSKESSTFEGQTQQIKKSFIVDEVNGTKFLKFFNNRKATKYALMCYCYNQTHQGRTAKWKELWFEQFQELLDLVNFRILNYFSVHYEQFLETVFPKLVQQRNALNSILKRGLQGGAGVKIKTLDGCVLEWEYYQSTSVKRSYYNPLTRSHHSYRVHKVQMCPKNKPKTDLQQHLTGFMPHLIHSIDAAVMRHIINRMYERCGYSINHLHDCVLMHPNYVDDFYEVVRELYCSNNWNHLAGTLFLEPFKGSLDEGTLADVLILEKNFYLLADNFSVDKVTFDPRNMYGFEC
jgi:hypothetical protein